MSSTASTRRSAVRSSGSRSADRRTRSSRAANATRLIGEQTKFLLSELYGLGTAGLLTNADTVTVAAPTAWPEYQRINAYVCQPNRAFREGLTHLGFDTDGAIQ